jgi:hypothetical protein
MATEETRPPYDDLAAIVREIAAYREGRLDNYNGDYLGVVICTETEFGGYSCRFCMGDAMPNDTLQEYAVDHDPSCVWLRARALTARLPPDGTQLP